MNELWVGIHFSEQSFVNGAKNERLFYNNPFEMILNSKNKLVIFIFLFVRIVDKVRYFFYFDNL